MNKKLDKKLNKQPWLLSSWEIRWSIAQTTEKSYITGKNQCVHGKMWKIGEAMCNEQKVRYKKT